MTRVVCVTDFDFNMTYKGDSRHQMVLSSEFPGEIVSEFVVYYNCRKCLGCNRMPALSTERPRYDPPIIGIHTFFV